MLPVFLHIEATPNPQQPDALQRYLSQAPAVLKSHGGVPVATYDVERTLDGKQGPGVIAVLSFPTRESIDEFFNDRAYKALLPLRDKGFSYIRFYVTSERI